MATILQNGVNKLTAWAGKCKLEFNASKTKMMIFTRKRTDIGRPIIKLGNERIEYVEEWGHL